MFTKLRISSHSLAIEKGRHKKIPQSIDIKCNFCAQTKDSCTCNTFKYHRICINCEVVEDEKHFLCHCPIYNDVRNDLNYRITNIFNLNSSDSDQCFISFMNYANGDSASELSRYWNDAIPVRLHHPESKK